MKWEVWRAREKHTSCSRCSREQLLLLEYIRYTNSYLNEYHVLHNIAYRYKLRTEKKVYYNSVCWVYQVIVFYPKTTTRQKRLRNISRPNIYSKNCNFSAQNRKKNDFHACTRPRSRFSILESLFTGIHSQNTE